MLFEKLKKTAFLFIISFFVFLCSSGLNAQDGIGIVHEGHYQGKNLYVQNPFSGTGIGFCVTKVTVNGDVTTDQINSSAFEIDFSNLNLTIGDPVAVKILHRKDCMPKVLNPEVLRPKSTFQISSISIESDDVLKWCTTDEQGKLTFTVEQYRWNKWIKIGEVDGKGTPNSNCYEFEVELHSKTNKFRVKQVDYSGKPNISVAASVESNNPMIALVAEKSRNLEFSNETLFEIYDTYGNLVKKGYGDLIDCTNLSKGLYYVNFDSTTGDIWNKK